MRSGTKKTYSKPNTTAIRKRLEKMLLSVGTIKELVQEQQREIRRLANDDAHTEEEHLSHVDNKVGHHSTFLLELRFFIEQELSQTQQACQKVSQVLTKAAKKAGKARGSTVVGKKKRK